MRRRGYTPGALNRFFVAIGMSRATNVIGMHVLEYRVRSDLDANAKQMFAAVKPLKITVQNFRAEEIIIAENHPEKAEMGRREVKLNKKLHIDKWDFRMDDSKGYYGLAPGKSAMLRYAYPLKVVDVMKGANGEALEFIGEFDYEK